MLAVIRREFRLVDELDVSQYVNELGDSVLEEAGSQYFDYHFYVINSREFNAFATPSGLIFFNSGIINTMENEGEFVSVLAHECGHVMSRHIAGRIEKSKQINAITLAAMLAGIAIGGGALSQAAMTGGMAAGQAMNLEFTRHDEEEADRIGFNLMRAQHRDPNDMVSMLNTMYKSSKIRMGNIPQYLLTHPKPELRKSYVQDLIHIQGRGDIKEYDQFPFHRMQKRVDALTIEPQKLLGRYRKAMRSAGSEYEKMIVTYGLALVDLTMGNYNKAVEKLGDIIKFFPHEPVLLTDLGRVYLHWGRLETALGYLEEARTKQPESWYSAFFLGKALQQSGNDDRAETLYKQVIAHTADYPKAYFQLAEIAAKRGNQALSHLYLGKNFYFEGNFQTSRFHFKKALEVATDKEKEEIEMMLGKIKKIEE